jgi:mono/diheme cytochrome c family protein
MKLKVLLAVIFAVSLAIGAAVAVSAAGGTAPPPYTGLKNPFPWNDVSARAAGQKIYQQSCAPCHGDTGSTYPKANFSAGDFPQKLEAQPDFYMWVVSEGEPQLGMPIFKASLTMEQRWQVLTYLWSLATLAPGQTPSVSNTQLDCVACHDVKLSAHDQLGAGDAACYACHSSTNMTSLHLANSKTTFPLTEYPQLCGQCHQQRYQQWLDGTHGNAAWKEGDTATRASVKVACVSCHDPHQPQIVLTDIIKPHPSPVPDSPAPPIQPMAMVGISLVIVVGLGVAAMKGGGQR